MRNYFQVKKFSAGITLLLVILVVSALLTIGVGVANVIYAELQISGELTSSFRALYAADQTMEYALYKVRDPNGHICETPGADCFSQSFSYPDGSCAQVSASKDALITVVAVGQFDCAPGSARVVKRSFEVTF